MGLYEETLIQHDYIEIREADVLPDNLDGVWLGDLILIKRGLSDREKAGILFEELAHNKLTYGDIADYSKFNNRKFENYARRHGFISAARYAKLWKLTIMVYVTCMSCLSICN